MDNQTTEVQQPQSEQPNVVVQDTNSQATAEVTNQEINFKDLIPENFKEEKSLENINNMEDLVKSFLHAQKLVGTNKIPVPNKHATDEDWQEVFSKLGAPETPEGYKYSFKDGEVDLNQIKSFNETAHKLGLLPKQAEGLIKYYNELNTNQASELESKAADAQLATETELKKEFGPQFAKRLDQAKKLAISTLGQDFLENTFLKDGSRLGDNLNVIKAFSGLADKLSEDEIVKGEGHDYQTASDIEKEINSLTQEGSAYWSNQHPNHTKAVQEVLKLREMLNG